MYCLICEPLVELVKLGDYYICPKCGIRHYCSCDYSNLDDWYTLACICPICKGYLSETMNGNFYCEDCDKYYELNK